MTATQRPADPARRLSAAGLLRAATVSAALLVVTLTGTACQHAVGAPVQDAVTPAPHATFATKATVATAMVSTTAVSPTSYAGPLCSGWDTPVSGQPGPCTVTPYTTHGYQNVWTNSYWNMLAVQETDPNTGVGADCTNYAAYVESTVYGVPAPHPVGLGNATDWAVNAQKDGSTVNHTPTVGSVAQWYANDNSPVIGTDGHVAIVEAVGPNDSYIVISQDNWHTDTDYYGWMKIWNAPDAPNTEPWPDNFIHFTSGRHGAAATLSYSHPNRLLQSTGNLYWTAARTVEVVAAQTVQVAAARTVRGTAVQTVQGTSEAVVYRASKTNQPGQERVLYAEAGSPLSPVNFQAITYANVGGSWYGYFVANYPLLHESVIKRVPLAGGAAVVLATSPAVIGTRDLVTDGSSLYWADAGGIRTMAINGGPVQTLASGGAFAHLGLYGSSLYYSSGNNILTVPASGGASTRVVSAPSAITALYPPSTANGLLWGEANGSVTSLDGDIYYEFQAPVAGVSVTSVSVAGNSVVWANCFPGWCQIDGNDNGIVASVATSGTPVDAQGDGGAWFWGDQSGLEKFAL
jgi:surface antigen